MDGLWLAPCCPSEIVELLLSPVAKDNCSVSVGSPSSTCVAPPAPLITRLSWQYRFAVHVWG